MVPKILSCVAVPGLALLAARSRAEAEEVRPPNFLVIMADDLGAKELGCYGHPRHRTPMLDRLAREGMRFETCWATPLCSPTRVLLMTGRYGFRTGWLNLIGRPMAPAPGDPDYDLGAVQITFADLLKQKGYQTALAGKWQLPGEGDGLVRDTGFDEYLIWAYKHNLPPGVVHTGAWEGKKGEKTARYWHPCLVQNGKYRPTRPTDYGPDLHADFVIDFMRRNRDQPFLVYCPMCPVHAPWDPTPDLDNPGKKTKGGLQANVEYLDDLVGRLVAAVDELGLRERTLILFTGDNGTGRDGKGTVTERGARVPLIARGLETKQGVVSRELVDLSDVFPTLAELAGASLPTDRVIDGKSLAGTLRGDPAPHREWIFSYLTDRRMLRDQRWLLEGDGRFFDCGEHRDGTGYLDVTHRTDPEVVAAKARFAAILEQLPNHKLDQPVAANGAAREIAR